MQLRWKEKSGFSEDSSSIKVLSFLSTKEVLYEIDGQVND